MERISDTGSETDLADLQSDLESDAPVQLILRWPQGLEVRSLSEGESLLFGRSRDAHLPIPDSRVSRRHTRIRLQQRELWVEDLGSRNGTFLGRHRLQGEARRAFGGDLIRIGPLDVVVAQVLSGIAAPSLGAGELEGIVVADPSTRQMFEVARRLSLTQTTVLIVGETGSGKEVVAEQIHRWSSRKDKPFVRVDSTGVGPALLDRSLDGGTLLLDEIGDLSPDLQGTLLSVLEHHRIDQQPIDVRILCATQRDLEEEVKAGRFRSDLYYRINTFTLRVPPLRERPEEILLLADHYAKAFARTLWVAPAAIDAGASSSLVSHSWPGNVRELKNAMEHAMVLATDGTIRREHLPRSVFGANGVSAELGNLQDRIEDVERQTIRGALQLEHGNQTKAARRLGITRRALIYRIERLGMRKELNLTSGS